MTSRPLILDSHVHFWHPRDTPRAVSTLVRLLGLSPRLVDWTAKRFFPRTALDFFASPRFITRPYLPEDYVEDCEGAVSGVVHVEAGWVGKGPMAPVEETRWLSAISEAGHIPIVAIVARADLSLGTGVKDVLKAHVEGSSLIRGVRDTLTWHPARGVLNGARSAKLSCDRDWRKGFEQLAELNLHFEATVYSNQLDELTELARAYPGQRIVLSHLATPVACGGPFGGVEPGVVIERWQDGMSRLAECPNVAVKLSGLAMPVCGFGYESRDHAPSPSEVAEHFAPFVQHAVNVFGADRCMYGSNFPVDKVSLPLATWQDAFLKIISNCTPEQQKQLLQITAEAVYRKP